MTHALEVEKVHYKLFNEALDAVKAGGDLPETAIRVCSVCGHTIMGDAPDKCPVCNASGSKFAEIP